jgi:predicted metal-dependent HD superfamily phosphohydrolase
MFDLLLTHHISEYVKSLYIQNQNPALLYHNLEHTEKVVHRTYEIAANYSFDEKEISILSAAAWFHDTGHLFGKAIHHEARSISIMRTYLQTKQVDKKIIDAVEGCILATELPQNPKTLLEEIVCDADTFNLGTKEFFDTDRLLKKEVELRGDIRIDNWEKNTLDLLTKHRYFTPYCQALLNKGKQENIEIVRSFLK